MDIRYAMHPDQMKRLESHEVRRHFLVEGLFEKDKINLVYSHIDRMIVGGVRPADQALELEVTMALVCFGTLIIRRGNHSVINARAFPNT